MDSPVPVKRDSEEASKFRKNFCYISNPLKLNSDGSLPDDFSVECYSEHDRYKSYFQNPIKEYYNHKFNVCDYFKLYPNKDQIEKDASFCAKNELFLNTKELNEKKQLFKFNN